MSTAAAAKSLQLCPLCATPQTAAHQAPPSLGFSRQEYWSGLPLASPSTQIMIFKCHFPPKKKRNVFLLKNDLFKFWKGKHTRCG